MATNLGLVLKIFADAGGVVQKLTPVQRAIQQVEKDAASVTAVFDRFGSSSAAAAAQQEKFAIRLQALQESLRSTLTTPEGFIKEFDALSKAASEAASDLDAASRVIEANLSREERVRRDFANSTAELARLRDQGMLTEEQYAAALERVSAEYARATVAADRYGDEATRGGDAGVLKFNELSGVLSALPGPIGNVAGRLSGLASAGEGLSRIFAGGLSQGISSIGASVAGLINQFTVAVAGVAAFGAAAVAVARGLVDLEDRVEKLGNTADKLGVSFEFIQTLEAAAARSGTSIDAVSSAFGRLQKSVTGVDEESKTAQTALKNLGITAEELQALKPEEQYKLIGERLQGIADPAQRTATAINLFGKAGAELLPFFKNLGGASDDMERFGRALTDIDRQRIDDFGAGIDALGVATQGLGQSLLLPFVGLGEGVSKAFAEIVAGVTAVVDPIGQVLEPVLTNIGRVIEAIGIGLGNFGRIVGAVFEPFATVVQGISQALEPLYEGFLDVFRTISDSQVAVTKWIMSFTSIGLIADNIGVVGDTLGRVITIITTAFGKAIEFVGDLAGQFGELVASSPLLETLGSVASSVFGTIAQVIGDLVSGIGQFVSDLLTIAEYWLGIDNSAKGAAEASAAATESTAEASKEAQKAAEAREKTFQRLREEVNNAIDDSRKFGEAGQEAALRYDASVERLKKSLSIGLIDEEQFRRSVRIAGQVFDEELKKIEDREKIEIKVKEDAAKAIEQVSESIDKAAIKAEGFGEAGSQSLAQFSRQATALRTQFAAGIIDEKQLEKSIEAANRQYERQLDQIKQANAERQKQIDADQKRSEALLDEMDKTRAVQRDREAVERQVATLRSEAAKQGFFTPEQRQQLIELQQLQGDLAEKQRAVAQGFEKGYSEAFDATKAKFQELAQKSREFGAEGERAAQQLASGLYQAQRAAQGGVISKEYYEAEVARQQKLYDEELKRLKSVADERLKTNQMVDEILLLQSVGGDTQRAEAKKKLIAIEEEMLRIQKEITAARKADDDDALRSGTARLAQLDQAAATERDIASGQAKFEQDFLKQSEEQQKASQQRQQQAQQAYAQEQAKIFEEQRKASEAEAKRQEERIAALNTLGSRTIQGTDIRTQEGAALVVGLAANAQDPALIQQRIQTKLLEKISEGITQAGANYFNTPVAIVGYSSFGAPR